MMVFVLAALLAAGRPTPASSPSPPPELAPETVLQRYAAALANHRSPRIVTFEYVLQQTGQSNTDQLHRVFRDGSEQRDELLALDGRRLDPPSVRISRHRRNRYTVEALAPSPAAYDFRYLGPHRVGKHVVYVFATAPKGHPNYAVRAVTIDGSSYLPTSISFSTAAPAGRGEVTFARADRYWLATAASAHATRSSVTTTERLVFSRYAFPPSLPPSTFATPKPLPSPQAPS